MMMLSAHRNYLGRETSHRCSLKSIGSVRALSRTFSGSEVRIHDWYKQGFCIKMEDKERFESIKEDRLIQDHKHHSRLDAARQKVAEVKIYSRM